MQDEYTPTLPNALEHTKHVLIQRECDAWVSNALIAELLDRSDALRHASATLKDSESDQIIGALVEVRSLSVNRELAQMRRQARNSPDLPNPDDARYQEWADLAAQIRARVDLPELIKSYGYPLHRDGTNSRRGAAEWAGPCILCGGKDRFRVWSGPNGQAWCRQCGWGGDAIVIVRSLDRGLTDSFYLAVAHVARWLGLPLPAARHPETKVHPPRSIAKPTTLPSGVTFHPIRTGGRRVG